MERTGAKGMTGKVALVLVSLLVGVLVGWMLNTQTAKEADVGRVSVGPHHIEDGVPVRYAQTREGAISAASNFARVRSGPLLRDEAQYLRAIDKMSSEDWRAEGERIARKDLSVFREGFGIGANPAAGIDSTPIRYRVDSFTSKRAEITVWLVALIQPSDKPIQSLWASGKYTLTWNGDWRILNAVPVDSPVPVPFDSPKSTGESPLRDFEGYEYAPSAT